MNVKKKQNNVNKSLQEDDGYCFHLLIDIIQDMKCSWAAFFFFQSYLLGLYRHLTRLTTNSSIVKASFQDTYSGPTG